MKKLTQPTQEEYYVLAEPNAQEDLDAWMAWIAVMEGQVGFLGRLLAAP